MVHPEEAEFAKKVDDLLDPIYGPRESQPELMTLPERYKNLKLALKELIDTHEWDHIELIKGIRFILKDHS